MPVIPLKVLLVEDSPADRLLIQSNLEFDPLATFEVVAAQKLADGLEALAGQRFDAVLLDLGLPDSQGLDTFQRLHQAYPELPVVILSGLADEEVATQAVHSGAQDYIVKSVANLAALARSVRYAVERQQAQRKLRESEDKFKGLLDSAPDGIVVINPAGQIVLTNLQVEKLFGYLQGELLGQNIDLLIPERFRRQHQAHSRQFFTAPRMRAMGGGLSLYARHKDGAEIPVEISLSYYRLADETMAIAAIRDISRRKQAEEKLRESEVLLRQVLESIPDSTFALDRDYRLLIHNQRHQQELVASGGHPFEIGEPMLSSDYPPEILDFWRTAYDRTLAGEEFSLEGSWVDLNGQPHVHENKFSPLRDAENTIVGILVIAHDITARKQAENALRESNDRFTQLAENIEEVFWMFDVVAQQMLYLSPTYEIIWGRPREKVYQDPNFFIETVFPDDLPLVFNIRERELQGEKLNWEYRIQCPDGSIRWIWERSFPVFDETGQLVRLTGIASDITDRKRIEQELLDLNRTLEERVKRQTAEVQDLYDYAPTGYYSLDGNGNFVRINQTALKWRGYTYEEMIGRPFTDFIAEPNRLAFEKNFSRFKQQGRMEDLEVEIIRKDGTTFPGLVNATAIYDEAGNYVMSRSILFDITERKKAENALRESQANLQNFLDSASDLIQSIDQAGNYLYVNHAWSETLGYTIEEARRLSMFQVIDPSYHDHCRQVLEDLMTGGQRHQLELIFRTKQGEAVVVEGSVNVHQEGGRTVTNGIFRDITRRKQAEQALHLANAELSRAARAKDEFLANMSHELRTPLNSILALSEVLQEQIYGPLTERQQKSIHNIESGGRHLLALINDILDLSKVEAGRLEIHLETAPVAEICQASLVFVKEIAMRKQVKLAYYLDNPLADVEADLKRLKQMLVNLLSNAVKFTPAGGQVSLNVTTDVGAGVIRFAVQDTGIGITPEGMAQLFQPFTQIDSSLNRQQEGTGLGLALVRRLAELHGGSVTVESEGIPGRGSCFTLALPYRVVDPEAGWQFQPSGTKLPQSALVVEDTESAAEQLAYYLQELNIHTTVYRQGVGVLEQVARVKPDVILMDLLLPDQSGWQVLTQLKTNPHTRDVPVVIVSVVDERTRGLVAGATEYLVKPISREGLRQALQAVINTPRPPQEALVIDPQPEPAAGGARILLAEDNELNIEAIEVYLRGMGYQVFIAYNGQEALDLAVEMQPDLILMDIQMPGMDGLEATRRLRAMPQFVATPIIALTALAMPGDRDRCLAAGANEYMTKPVSLKALVQKMVSMLNEQSNSLT